MGTGGAPINEVVNLLSEINPSLLAKFVEESPPELRPSFRPGGVAGETGPQMRSRASFCITTLEEIVPHCEVAIAKARARVRLVRRISLASGLIAVVGGSSVIATVPLKIDVVTLISGSLALLGSLLTFAADFFGKLENNPQGNVVDAFNKLVLLRYRADQLRSELEAFLSSSEVPAVEPIMTKLIGESNSLCLEIHQTGDIFLK